MSKLEKNKKEEEPQYHYKALSTQVSHLSLPEGSPGPNKKSVHVHLAYSNLGNQNFQSNQSQDGNLHIDDQQQMQLEPRLRKAILTQRQSMGLPERQSAVATELYRKKSTQQQSMTRSNSMMRGLKLGNLTKIQSSIITQKIANRSVSTQRGIETRRESGDLGKLQAKLSQLKTVRRDESIKKMHYSGSNASLTGRDQGT